MNKSPSTAPVFNTVADRRTHEIARLPDDLRALAEEIERKAERKAARLRDLQERRHEQDVEKERKKIRRDRPEKTYEKEKWRMSSPLRRDGQDIDRAAEHTVEGRNAEALAAIDVECEVRIGEVLALARDRDPNLAQDESAIEALREARKSGREANLYQGIEHDLSDRGRER
jgi:hypothetical protein